MEAHAEQEISGTNRRRIGAQRPPEKLTDPKASTARKEAKESAAIVATVLRLAMQNL